MLKEFLGYSNKFANWYETQLISMKLISNGPQEFSPAGKVGHVLTFTLKKTRRLFFVDVKSSWLAINNDELRAIQLLVQYLHYLQHSLTIINCNIYNFIYINVVLFKFLDI